MDINIDHIPDENNNKKCYSCGKIFRTPANLLTHKNRKTPCLIREVAPADLEKPNRCIFCNKIFSNKSNLQKHSKTCKIKNGGMDILVGKVRYEQEIRILKEKDHEKEKELERMQSQIETQTKQLETQTKQIEQLQNQMKQLAVDTKSTKTTININAPVQITNITINNYVTPSTIGLQITLEELATVTKLSKFLFQKLYFNPELPQNHCMYLVNKKDKSLLIYRDNKWEIVMGDNLEEVIIKLKDTVYIKGIDLINGKDGPYRGKDDQFLKLSNPDQEKIKQFNQVADLLSRDDAYEIFLAGREVVLETIRNAGCKLI